MFKNIFISYLFLVLCFATITANADVVVVVSSQSKVPTMTKEQVQELYLGASRELPGGGTALLVAGTGAIRDEFYDKVLGKEAPQVKSIWSRLVFSGKRVAPREVADVVELKHLVSTNPSTVGFIDKSAIDSSVKVVFAP